MVPRAWVAKTRQAYPDVYIDEEVFAGWIDSLDLCENLGDHPRLPDLFLAFACANNDARAIKIFSQTVEPAMRRAAERICKDPDLAAEHVDHADLRVNLSAGKAWSRRGESGRSSSTRSAGVRYRAGSHRAFRTKAAVLVAPVVARARRQGSVSPETPADGSG
jgi:hypothetical protein